MVNTVNNATTSLTIQFKKANNKTDATGFPTPFATDSEMNGVMTKWKTGMRRFHTDSGTVYGVATYKIQLKWTLSLNEKPVPNADWWIVWRGKTKIKKMVITAFYFLWQRAKKQRLTEGYHWSKMLIYIKHWYK